MLLLRLSALPSYGMPLRYMQNNILLKGVEKYSPKSVFSPIKLPKATFFRLLTAAVGRCQKLVGCFFGLETHSRAIPACIDELTIENSNHLQTNNGQLTIRYDIKSLLQLSGFLFL